MIKRKGILIYGNISENLLNEMAKLGIDIEYTNKKAGYIVGYLDEGLYDKCVKLLSNIKGVKKIEESLFELPEFNNVIKQ